MLRGGGGIVDRVKCIVCSHVKGREVTMGAKSDTLEKHAGKRQAKSDLPHINVKKDEFYVNKKCAHLRAAASYNGQSHGQPSVLQQVRHLHFLGVLHVAFQSLHVAFQIVCACMLCIAFQIVCACMLHFRLYVLVCACMLHFSLYVLACCFSELFLHFLSFSEHFRAFSDCMCIFRFSEHFQSIFR